MKTEITIESLRRIQNAMDLLCDSPDRFRNCRLEIKNLIEECEQKDFIMVTDTEDKVYKICKEHDFPESKERNVDFWGKVATDYNKIWVWVCEKGKIKSGCSSHDSLKYKQSLYPSFKTIYI